MTPLERIDTCWEWYEAAHDSLLRLRRIADKYWDDLPWEGGVQMGRDGQIGKLTGERVVADTTNALSRLDDLAVMELFSVFEGIVRVLVAEQVEKEAVALIHPMLKAAARDAIDAADRRSFAAILDSYSKGGHADLAEQVRQVRRYRNWISHGRRGKQQQPIDPKTAYQRLRSFLELLLPPPTTPDAIPDAIP